MVKRIIWTSKAYHIFTKILDYYINQNESKAYSRKLNAEIHSLLKILLKQPLLGIKTENEKIRVFIHGNYKVFYQIEGKTLIIHQIWDCRQNPDHFKI